jgi:hypothetical protein
MSLLDSLGGILQQYASGAAPAGDVSAHYQQISQAVPPASVADGLAAALRSGGASGFGQMASQLFNNSGGAQQAGLLNQLLASAGPSVLSQFLGANAGSTLSNLLGGGQTQLTPQQAASVPPEEVQALAQHVHNAAPGVVDAVSQIYAEHPQLVQTLGAAAMALAIRKIAERHATA